MTDFTIPSFLQNHSTDEIHERMKAILPPDLDLSEGGHAWNMTRSSALIAAEICEFVLPQVISLIFPEHSYGEFLDMHAKSRSITRHEATAATGEITITGAAETAIKAGSVFSTASINDAPSVDYETIEDAVIPSDGTITIQIRCKQTGVVGNTTKNTVIFNSGNIDGIESVTNADAITGGTEIEDDDSLIERILHFDKSQGENYVGNVSDYKRWATSVDGVGSATIMPAADDSGLVTIIITDANGAPATEHLCEEVYNYIMRPDNPDERLSPVNASISVVPPSTMNIAILATVELLDGYTVESVKTSFASNLSTYLPFAMDDNEIKYSKIYAALSASDGVNDFSGLQIGIKGGSMGTNNIQITTTSLPVISVDDINLVVGTV